MKIRERPVLYPTGVAGVFVNTPRLAKGDGALPRSKEVFACTSENEVLGVPVATV